MNQCERFKMILSENNLKQRQFASEIGVSESYVSMLLKKPEINLSQSLASLIEEKYGYSSSWILTGSEPKFKQISKKKSLSVFHQKALAQLEKMNEQQIKAVLAFINSLDQIEMLLKEDSEENSVPQSVEEAEEEYIKNVLNSAPKRKFYASSTTNDTTTEKQA